MALHGNLGGDEMRRQFYYTKPDVKWLRETHLKYLTRMDFKSFTLMGNEDCPQEIKLYRAASPHVGDVPVAVLKLDEDGKYVFQVVR